MDVYGFYGADSSYQYNQSNELANQLYAQQALSSSVPFTPGAAGVANMPMPSGSPWNSRGLTWGMPSPPQLVQFTGQTPFKDEKVGPVMHCKRKSLDIEPVIPAKQLITEEKMAAHLNGLHISSDYTSHAANQVMDVTMDTRDTEPFVEKIKGHTIVLSEEVKRLREEPLLPAALIERLEKPSMSLVVWKPRDNVLEQIKEMEPKQEDEEDAEPNRRVGVLVNNNINDFEMWTSGNQSMD